MTAFDLPNINKYADFVKCVSKYPSFKNFNMAP